MQRVVRNPWFWATAGLGVVLLFLAFWVLIASPFEQPPSDAQPSETSQPDTTGPPTRSEVEQLDDRLMSKDPELLTIALGLEAGKVSDIMTAEFAALDITWNHSGVAPVGDEGVAWTIPASVTQPDGTETAWVVTLVRGETGLVFVDSTEVMP